MGLFPPLRPHFDAALRDASSDNPRSRALAVTSLGSPPEGREREAVEALLGRVDDPHPEVRAGALSAIARLGDADALEPILARFDDGDATVRQVALIAAGELGDPRAMPRLERALRADEPELRFQAIGAIAALAPEDAGPMLVRLVDDPDREVRERLAESIAALEDARCQGALERMLEDEAREVRWSAGIGLARLGSAAGADAMIGALEDRDRCFEAAWALAEVGAQQAVEPLAQLAQSFLAPLACKAAAAAALIRLGDDRGAPALRGVLTAFRWEARSYAAELVGELAETSLAPELAALVRRPRGADLVVVARALAKLAPSSPVAREALEQLATQPGEAGEAARGLLEDGGLD